MQVPVSGWRKRGFYLRLAFQEKRGTSGQGSRACPADLPAADGARVVKAYLSCNASHEPCKLVDHKQHVFSVSRQCLLPSLPRSTLSYRPVQVRQTPLLKMARIYTYLAWSLHWLQLDFAYLGRQTNTISPSCPNLMRRIGLWTIHQKVHTSETYNFNEWIPCIDDLIEVIPVDQVFRTAITQI